MTDVMNINDVTWQYLNPDYLNADKNPAVVTVGGEEFVVEIDYGRWEHYYDSVTRRQQLPGMLIPVLELDDAYRERTRQAHDAFTAYLCTLPAVPREAWEAVQDRRSLKSRKLV
jgi:hypothetical protein